ncbi:polysaccharide deacetylase family protein [Clostridium grantii]|uniref:Peptidoglycan/xylan/chitin deacetylase, PgdA/CDA1 family n=1 Tax=Clostridium grantii DSM 8605 TaxID=1121316 RepID=A0A1M5RJW0_9CLOT|nr:polysaccharide deacetylase family protein [Clostridium grantii]SHH26531.1 Peptidoglycan/xylan/chitin deacetylase, PgdA/CDA1 family [Clostridium grantii DSM 8605]
MNNRYKRIARIKKRIGICYIFLLASIMFLHVTINAVPTIYSSMEEEKEVKENSKKVYITFDDGPSINNTRNIIKILNDNNVKASFFIVGNKAEEYPDIVKELSENNMCIASHTYSHVYEEVFKNLECYKNDLQKCNESIENIIEKAPVQYIRIPGGINNSSSNKNIMEGILNYLNQNNVNYVGWNICSNDALGRNIPSYKLMSNIKTQTEKIENKTNCLVVLMHDSYYKKTTVEVLPEIIQYYKDKGYEFRTFNDITSKEYEELFNEKLINKQYFK